MIDRTSKIESYKYKVKSVLDYARGSSKNEVTVYQLEDDFTQFYGGQKLFPVVRDLGFDSTTDFLKVCGFNVDGAWVSTASGAPMDSAADNVISLMQRTVPKLKHPDSFRTQTRPPSSALDGHQSRLRDDTDHSSRVSFTANTSVPPYFRCSRLNPEPMSLGNDLPGYSHAGLPQRQVPSTTNSISGEKIVSKSTDPVVKPLPRLTKGSVLKVGEYLKPDFFANAEYYYLQQYNEKERARLVDNTPGAYKPKLSVLEDESTEKSPKPKLKDENEVVWTIVGKVENATMKFCYSESRTCTAYFLCRTLCEDTLTLNDKLQKMDRTRVAPVSPVEAEAGTRCVVVLSNTFCRGTIVDAAGRKAVVRLYDYDMDTVEIPWDKVYHAAKGVFSRNPLCVWVLSREKQFELKDVVKVDFGRKLSSCNYRDYYGTRTMIRV